MPKRVLDDIDIQAMREGDAMSKRKITDRYNGKRIVKERRQYEKGNIQHENQIASRHLGDK